MKSASSDFDFKIESKNVFLNLNHRVEVLLSMFATKVDCACRRRFKTIEQLFFSQYCFLTTGTLFISYLWQPEKYLSQN